MRGSHHCEAYINFAQSTPGSLPGPEPNTVVTVASLRQAVLHFDCISEAIASMLRVSTATSSTEIGMNLMRDSSSVLYAQLSAGTMTT